MKYVCTPCLPLMEEGGGDSDLMSFFWFSFDTCFVFSFQLDFCQKMAEYLTRTSTGYAMFFFISIGMGGCCISSCGAYHVGMLANHNIRSRYCWSGCNNGWHCSFIGILFNHAVVEDSMAKLKYASSWPAYFLFLLPFNLKGWWYYFPYRKTNMFFPSHFVSNWLKFVWSLVVVLSFDTRDGLCN